MKTVVLTIFLLTLSQSAWSQKYPQKLDNDICTNLIVDDFVCKGCATSDKDLPSDVRDDIIEILQRFKYCKVLSREKLAQIVKTGDEEAGIGSLNAEQRTKLRSFYQADRMLFGDLKIQSDGSLLVTVEINNLTTTDREGYKRFTVPASKFEVYDTRQPFIEKSMVAMLLGSSEAAERPGPASEVETANPPKKDETATTKPAPVPDVNSGIIVWQNSSGQVSLWKIDAQGNRISSKENNIPGWSLVNCSGNKVLWRHTSGKISLWTIDADGNVLKYKEHGPLDGWTAISYSDNRILWRHTSGKISLWTVDDDGNHVRYKEHGPFGGWTALFQASDNIVWQHTNSNASLWKIDSYGNQSTYKEHPGLAGWSLVNCSGNKVLWRHTSGKISLWTVDGNGNVPKYKEHGPIPGWTAINYFDHKILWRHNAGGISLWTIDDDGNQLSYKEHPAAGGWTALYYTNPWR